MKDIFYVKLGNLIKDLRKSKNLTREELSEKVDISTKFLYEIEYGKKGHSVFIFLKLLNELTEGTYEIKCRKCENDLCKLIKNIVNLVMDNDYK